MSDEILLRPEDARAAAADMRSNAAAADDQFTNTRSRLTDLQAGFRGRTARSFDARFEEWRSSAASLVEALDGLAVFLESASDTIEQVDADIAAQLAG